MCLLLERTYKCWLHGAFRQHSYRYLNRCASPRYAECIDPEALGLVKETYDIPCPACTNKFFHPQAKPTRVATNLGSVDENGPKAQAAAREYTKSLIEFLIMAFAEVNTAISASEDQWVFRVSKMESACRFDKSHFHNGAYCEKAHCADPTQSELFDDIKTNRLPELHNISAAMRRAVSHGYLFPYRGFWPSQYYYDPVLLARGGRYVTPVTYTNHERPRTQGAHDNFQPSYESCVQRHLAQPDLQILETIGNPILPRGAPVSVIPFLKPDLDDAARSDKIWLGVFCSTIKAMGGPDAWEASWLNSSMASDTEEIISGFDAEYERIVRNDVCLIATKLLAHDSGLSDARAVAVAEFFKHIFEINPIDRGNNVGPELLALFEKLLDAARESLRHKRHQYAGEILARNETLRYTQYHFKRNLMLRLQDEHDRQRIIESTVEPLTQLALEALDPDDRDCVACGEEMACSPHPHAGMRIKCGAGHVIGMSCWMRSQRRKKSLLSDGLKCHSCAHKILKPWKMPIDMVPVDAYSVVSADAEDLQVPDTVLDLNT